MDKQNQKAVAFRKKAADLRASAAGFSPTLQRDIVEIAQRYEILADQIERVGAGKKDEEDQTRPRPLPEASHPSIRQLIFALKVRTPQLAHPNSSPYRAFARARQACVRALTWSVGM